MVPSCGIGRKIAKCDRTVYCKPPQKGTHILDILFENDCTSGGSGTQGCWQFVYIFKYI